MKTAATPSLYALAAAMTLLLAEGASGQMSGPAGKPLPKLVLFMVIDGFPQDQFVKYYDQYGPRGFKLWLDKGAWYGTITTAMRRLIPAWVMPRCYHVLIPTSTV